MIFAISDILAPRTQLSCFRAPPKVSSRLYLEMILVILGILALRAQLSCSRAPPKTSSRLHFLFGFDQILAISDILALWARFSCFRPLSKTVSRLWFSFGLETTLTMFFILALVFGIRPMSGSALTTPLTVWKRFSWFQASWFSRHGFPGSSGRGFPVFALSPKPAPDCKFLWVWKWFCHATSKTSSRSRAPPKTSSRLHFLSGFDQILAISNILALWARFSSVLAPLLKPAPDCISFLVSTRFWWFQIFWPSEHAPLLKPAPDYISFLVSIRFWRFQTFWLSEHSFPLFSRPS